MRFWRTSAGVCTGSGRSTGSGTARRDRERLRAAIEEARADPQIDMTAEAGRAAAGARTRGAAGRGRPGRTRGGPLALGGHIPASRATAAVGLLRVPRERQPRQAARLADPAARGRGADPRSTTRSAASRKRGDCGVPVTAYSIAGRAAVNMAVRSGAAELRGSISLAARAAPRRRARAGLGRTDGRSETSRRSRLRRSTSRSRS